MKIAAINSQTWYPNHIGFELLVLRAYVKAVEEQIKNSANWKEKAEVVETIEIPEEGIYHETSMVDGLDDTTYSFETIFDEYFPQLQRQSALIVLYSFLERELDHLCELCCKSTGATLRAKDLCKNGSEIARYHLYLEKVIGLNISRDDGKWQAIDHAIRIVRNQIVHKDGRVPEQDSKDCKKLETHVNQLKGRDLISIDGNSIVLSVGYLEYVLDAFDKFFETLHSSISTPEAAKTEQIAS